jgi:hypothetical protein
VSFVSDTFTDAAGTLLTAHTPDVGGAWSKDSNSSIGPPVISDVNTLRSGDTSFSYVLYLNAGSPATAEYDVEADFKVVSGAGLVALHLFVHGDNLGGGYRGGWDGFGGHWNIGRGYGSSNVLDAGTAATLTNGQTYHVKLTVRVSGGTSTLTLYVDGVQKATATDANYAAAGKSGIQWATNTADNTSGLQLDNFAATDVGGGGGGGAPVGKQLTAGASQAVKRASYF